MFKLILRNPWIAAAWVLATLGSAAAFVSEDGGQAMIDQAADKIRAQSHQSAKLESRSESHVIEEGVETAEEGPPTQRPPGGGADETMAPDGEADTGDTYVVLDKPAPENQPSALESY